MITFGTCDNCVNNNAVYVLRVITIQNLNALVVHLIWEHKYVLEMVLYNICRVLNMYCTVSVSVGWGF